MKKLFVDETHLKAFEVNWTDNENICLVLKQVVVDYPDELEGFLFHELSIKNKQSVWCQWKEKQIT